MRKKRTGGEKRAVPIGSFPNTFTFYFGGTIYEIHRLRACETLWSAREIASAALSAERERHTENVFHIVLSLFSVIGNNLSSRISKF